MKQYHYKTAPKRDRDKVISMYIEAKSFDQEGLLPEALFEYKNIAILGIRGSVKQFPEDLAQRLPNLKELSIAFMSADALPNSIGDCTQLEKIAIAVTDKTLVLPPSFSKLKSLKSLSLRECHLTEIPKVLTALPLLEELRLSSNNIKETLAEKCYWKNLKTLFLNGNQYTTLPKWVYWHSELDILNISYNQVEKVEEEIRNLKALRVLDLKSNQIAALPVSLATLQKLSIFDWTENPLGEIVPVLFDLNEAALDFGSGWGEREKQKMTKAIIAIKKLLAKSKIENKAALIAIICAVLNSKTITEKYSNQEILACYTINNQRLREAVIAIIEQRLPAFEEKKFGRGAELLILGKTIKTKTVLKDNLSQLGIKLTNKKTAQTTHVLLGKNMKKLEALYDNDLIVLNENQLNHYLDTYAPAYLVEETEGKDQNTANLKEMFWSFSDETILVALQLLKGGGVPKGLITTLFAIHKMTANAKITRQTKKLLELNASAELLEGMKKRFILKQASQGFFSIRNYIDEICAKTELNKIELTTFCNQFSGAVYPYSAVHTWTIKELPIEKQAEPAQAYWDTKIKNKAVELKSGDNDVIQYLYQREDVEKITAYPATFLSAHHLIVGMKNLQVIALAHEPRKLFLPKDFAQLEQLHTLELNDIADFRPEAWEALQQLDGLKKVEITTKKYPFPLGVFELEQLEQLKINSFSLLLDFPLEKLKNLKTIEIEKSSLEGTTSFFEKIKNLPQLKDIKLHKELDELYQAYLKGE